MWKLLVLTAFLSLESGHVNCLQGHDTASMPYQFSYHADASEGSHSRSEQRDDSGRVTGHYTITTEEGQQRVVCYVADENGFRAWVDTNEQGTANEDPSSVSIRSSASGTGDAPRQPIKGICGRPPATTQTVVPPPSPPAVVVPPVRKPAYVPVKEVTVVQPPPVVHRPPPPPPPPPKTVIVQEPPRAVLPPPSRTEFVPTAEVTIVEPKRPVNYPPPPPPAPVVKTVYVPPQQVIVQEPPRPKTPFRKVSYQPDDEPSNVPVAPAREVYYPSPVPPRPTVAPPTFVPRQDTYGPPSRHVYVPPVRSVTYVPVVQKVVAKVVPAGGEVPTRGYAVRKVYRPPQVTRFEPSPQVTYHTNRRVATGGYGNPAYDVPIGTSYKMTVSRSSYDQPRQIYEYASPTSYTYQGRPSSSYRQPCSSCGSASSGYETAPSSYPSPSSRRRTRPSSYSRNQDIYEFDQPTYG
ncbi:uncharacterized protein LOC135399835 isoform X2 [Ornithodoros turicata]|uniref:uncharacterized protein LOC135399835 isoform X2 n=1 Tax=Ornithodoros turicata TaxID=34597 RepID=UPI0031391370